MSSSRIRASFRAQIKANAPLVGAATGSGLSTRHVLAGGADFILSATGGRFRYSGVPSVGAFTSMDNANDFILDFAAREILPRSHGKPVIIGVSPNDPTNAWEHILRRIREGGFHGVNNFPSVGFYDGPFRKTIERAGFTFAREVDFLIRAADEGLFTLAFVYTPEDAALAASRGIDAVCATVQTPAGDNVRDMGPSTIEAAAMVYKGIFNATREADPGCICLFYGGGPIASPEDMDTVLHATAADGYIGGSVFERIPTAHAVEEMTSQYKQILSLSSENNSLRQELMRKKGFDEIVGQSRIMQDLFEVVNKVADKNVNVLITGESGTGKELIVKAIHFNSRRRDQPFIKVNCAAIPEALLESELFGHTKGAFTGATGDRVGLFQLADKGTLFLDEIGELNLGMQAKLLRVIQQRELQRVGSDKIVKLDFRLVAATNIDLTDRMAQGLFREDLFYRLNVVSIHTPPLRRRKEDIALLAAFFLRRIAEKFEQPVSRLHRSALDALEAYDWPGNVRELEHALESASILCQDNVITMDNLPAAIRGAVGQARRYDDRPDKPRAIHQPPIVAELPGEAPPIAHSATDAYLPPEEAPLTHAEPVDPDEKAVILRALAENAWRRDKTATALGVSRKTLYNKMVRYGIAGRG